MNLTEFNLLVSKIKDAVTCSVKELFNKYHNEEFYYISLITSGEAHTPILSAWSYQALFRQAKNKEDEYFIKWSYADSPYTMYKNSFFEEVKKIFQQRSTEEIYKKESMKEFDFRINAMVKAMQLADKEGIFGSGENRLNVLINVEVIPPDESNVERAIKLNPSNSKILPIWIVEAGEE